MPREISIEALLQKEKEEAHTMIDVRSPKEYQEGTIPGAVNIPVFNDEERAEIGTIYKQVSPEAAKQRGLEIFSDKLPRFIEAFKKFDTPMTVFCWRGGMRSKTAASVLDLMGIHANRLTGGIRTYRQWVVQQLANIDFKPELVVLNGYTGSGKTWLLQRLLENGYPVIDLEKMAGHRGSIFGQIGLDPNNQKKFDSLLVADLLRYQDKPFVFIEGESKRIGKVLLPDFICEKKDAGTQLFIHLPIEERVAHILGEYEPGLSPERFLEAYQFIKKRIHVPVAKEIEEYLKAQNYRDAVRLLLEYYYDPRYDYGMKKTGSHIIDIQADNLEDALQKIKEFFSKLKKN